MNTPVLAQFMSELVAGKIRIVDLTETLSPDFPTIVLPPEFGQAWPFRIEEISRYDERGPAWYWNNFSCSEHTGTHFDAPVHWVSGKDQPDNTVDTIPIQAFIAEAARHLAPMLATLENILDPETIILGGALPDAVIDDLIIALTPLPISVSSRPIRARPRLMRGQTGQLTAALGAAALPLLETITPKLDLAAGEALLPT